MAWIIFAVLMVVVALLYFMSNISSKKQIEEFIENNMEDEVMDASKINIADEEEFEKLIWLMITVRVRTADIWCWKKKPEMVEKDDTGIPALRFVKRRV